jgi:hypothetical protein
MPHPGSVWANPTWQSGAWAADTWADVATATTTPTLSLCDALVGVIDAGWSGQGVNDGVSRVYFIRIADVDDSSLKLLGRKVYVFPTNYSYAGFTRGEDQYQHEISVLCVERYTEARGDPPTSWIDDRVDFVYNNIVQLLDYDGRSGATATFNRNLLTDNIEIQVCDVEKITGGGKLFFSLVNFTFVELVDV